MTASCDRLKNFAYSTAVLTASDSPVPQPTEWQRIGNQIKAAMIFA
jgi:hypothetical protein